MSYSRGTTARQPRIHKFKISLNTILPTAPSPPNLKFTHLNTTHFNDSAGSPISGLDLTTSLPFDGFPNLPAAKFTGDDFGGEGPGCNRLSLDPDGLVFDTPTLTADSMLAPRCIHPYPQGGLRFPQSVSNFQPADLRPSPTPGSSCPCPRKIK